MKLFLCNMYSSVPVENYLKLSTPLGNLDRAYTLDAHPLQLASLCYQHTSRSATIYQWISPQCLLEELLFSFTPPQPILAASSLACHALVVRLKSLASQVRAQLALSWQPGYHWIQGYAETGEGLAARSWIDPKWKVTVGTEDYEYLAARSKANRWMPPRLASLIEERADEIVKMKDTSITIELPELQNGEKCQVQFVVASSEQRDDDVTTWLAVDQSPAFLLKSAQCDY